LIMSCRDNAKGGTGANFGYLRIVYENNTKVLVLATSVDLDAAKKAVTVMSASLHVGP
jgi:hypothetical protein